MGTSKPHFCWSVAPQILAYFHILHTFERSTSGGVHVISTVTIPVQPWLHLLLKQMMLMSCLPLHCRRINMPWTTLTLWTFLKRLSSTWELCLLISLPSKSCYQVSEQTRLCAEMTATSKKLMLCLFHLTANNAQNLPLCFTTILALLYFNGRVALQCLHNSSISELQSSNHCGQHLQLKNPAVSATIDLQLMAGQLQEWVAKFDPMNG